MSDPESRLPDSVQQEPDDPTEEFLAAMAYVPSSDLESLYPPTTHELVGPLDQMDIPDYSVFAVLVPTLPLEVMTSEQLFEALANEEPPVRPDDTASASVGVADASGQVGTETKPTPVAYLGNDDLPAVTPDSNSTAKLIRFTQVLADPTATPEPQPLPPLESVLTLTSDHTWYQFAYLEHPLKLSHEEEIRAHGEYQALEGMQDYFELQPLDWVINYFVSLASHLKIFDPHFFFDDLVVTELVTSDENRARKYLWHHFGQRAQMPGGIGSDVLNPDDALNRELKQMTVLESVAVGLELRRLALWLLFAEVFGENKRVLPYPEPFKFDTYTQPSGGPSDNDE